MKRLLLALVGSAVLTGAVAASPGSVGASAADGCSVSHAGVLSETVVYCSGGYMGRVGWFRARQKEHWLFGTSWSAGPWRLIGGGVSSETPICGGFWCDSSGYELSAP